MALSCRSISLQEHASQDVGRTQKPASAHRAEWVEADTDSIMAVVGKDIIEVHLVDIMIQEGIATIQVFVTEDPRLQQLAWHNELDGDG